MPIRLQKYMAYCGVGARRKCEELIKEGKVSVDGVIVSEMGFKVDPLTSRVELNGKPLLMHEKKVYIALNKPVCVITSANDQFGRKTVLDLVKTRERVFPVGRLDYNSSGLIFLTNDGDFAYKLTHPKHNIDKTYYVTVDGVPDETALRSLQEGVSLEDGMTMPAKVSFVKRENNGSSLEITVTEGRNRLVRRMFDAIGHPVLSLHRVSVGKIGIGGLKPGTYRFLSDNEVDVLIGEF